MAVLQFGNTGVVFTVPLPTITFGFTFLNPSLGTSFILPTFQQLNVNRDSSATFPSATVVPSVLVTSVSPSTNSVAGMPAQVPSGGNGIAVAVTSPIGIAAPAGTGPFLSRG